MGAFNYIIPAVALITVLSGAMALYQSLKASRKKPTTHAAGE
jgi:hypothetical protein